jgi:prepilin-type N-terminal cleavage/methylation domain-containing protein
MNLRTQLRSRGFTLVELALVLIIMALMGGAIVSVTFSLRDTQRAVTTRAKLAAIDAAIVSFVAVNRRLPCPANGQLNTGTEMSPCQNPSGVVPWVALGLAAQDIEDGWNNRISYRIDTLLGGPDGMNMSGCDPAGTGIPTAIAPNITCTLITGPCSSAVLTNCVEPQRFLSKKGLEIKDAIGGTPLMNPDAVPATGAAYVLFSHGENQAGAFSPEGVMASAIGVTGTIEAFNSAATPPAYYVDTPQVFTDTASRFDDFVLRPSVLTVIQRAYLGPRSH